MKIPALETYVHQGGHLVLCQSPQWQQYLDFGDLLPVTLQGVDAKKTLEPLRELAHADEARSVTDPKTQKTIVLDIPGIFSPARSRWPDRRPSRIPSWMSGSSGTTKARIKHRISFAR